MWDKLGKYVDISGESRQGVKNSYCNGEDGEEKVNLKTSLETDSTPYGAAGGEKKGWT